nr:hypothetical protein [Tanacetum cinerariifolium]
MGYEKPSTKLTFYKAFFSSQWKFFIHTLLQSLSAKRTSWNEFSTAMASAENVVEDVAHNAIPSPPSHDIPSPSQEQSSPPQQPQSSPQAPPQGVEASKRIESSNDMEDVFNQGRMINDLDKDEGIELVVDQVKDADIDETEGRHAAEQAEKQAEIYHLDLDLDHPSKVLSMQEDDSEVQGVVEVVTTAKLITDVVTVASQVSAASATISAAKPSIPVAALTVVAAYTRRRKGVIIRDPEEELSSKTPVETPKLKDKGKGILIETPKPMKKKDQIELDAEYARKLHEEINKDHEEINKDIDWDAAIDHTESEARKNMMIYLKNTAGYKMDFFKGMSYDEICLIFQDRFDANMRFLFKSREEIEEEDQEVLKSINETPAQKAAKRRKLNEEAQEAKDLKKCLEVVDDEDDDVFIEATPLARKNLWEIVKERFSTSKPTNFSDEYLLTTLKTMFEKPDGQDAVWKSQRSVHGLALVKSWKLLTSCGVHILLFQLFSLFNWLKEDITFKVHTGTIGECNKTSASAVCPAPRLSAIFRVDIIRVRVKCRRARIDQSSALPTAVDEPASPLGDDSQEIASLKARIKMLEDKDGGVAEPSGEDATIKGRSLEIGDFPPAVEVPIGSGMVPTNSPIFTTAGVASPYSRRKGKEKMVESETPKKKKIQEQMDVQMARELEKEMARDAQRMNEQIIRDAEIARIHAEEELQMLIDGLDRSNEQITKHLHDYEQAADKLTIGERIEQINELVKYQDHHSKILKEKFIPVWKQIEDFVPMASKKEGERMKRKGLRLEQESPKKMKTSEEVSEEDFKEMMKLVPVEEVYVEALQTLVKETLSIRHATSDKEKELWVDLKRLYEPDVEDQLWTHTQALMHDPTEWRLYDTCVVHHVLSRDQEIFMMVEREYPLRKGVAIVMISNKLQCQPEGFIDAGYSSHVYKLKKALYGLKQALRAWYDELSIFLLQNRFSKGTIDPTLFTRRFDDDILVNQSPSGIFINQSKYVHEILKKYSFNTCDIIGTPMDIKDKLDLDQIGTPVDATKYHSMIGALMYLTSSRPDIVHATCVCARYQAHPTEKHLKEVKRISRFLQTQLTDYGYHFDKIPIYCDSKSAIAISCNPVQHFRTKHVAVRYHFIKEHVEKGTIELYFVKTDYQLADIFNKALLVDRFNYLVRRLGMRSLCPQELDRLAKLHDDGNPSRANIKQALGSIYTDQRGTVVITTILNEREQRLFNLYMLFKLTLIAGSIKGVTTFSSQIAAILLLLTQRHIKDLKGSIHSQYTSARSDVQDLPQRKSSSESDGPIRRIHGYGYDILKVLGGYSISMSQWL